MHYKYLQNMPNIYSKGKYQKQLKLSVRYIFVVNFIQNVFGTYEVLISHIFIIIK
jgi:hypothetical protein